MGIGVKRYFLICLAASFFAGPALAQDEPQADDGVYMRIGGGATFLNDWEQDYVFNPNILFFDPPPRGQRLDLGSGFLAGAAVGFDYADGIRTELEYRYASVSIDSAAVDQFDFMSGFALTPFTPDEDSIDAHFVFTNFYFDFHNNSPLTPFIGGGVGGAFVSNESGERDAALAYQGRAGVSLALGGGFSADLEYIFTRTNKLAYGPRVEDFMETAPFGPAVIGERYQASSAMLSLRKFF